LQLFVVVGWREEHTCFPLICAYLSRESLLFCGDADIMRAFEALSWQFVLRFERTLGREIARVRVIDFAVLFQSFFEVGAGAHGGPKTVPRLLNLSLVLHFLLSGAEITHGHEIEDFLHHSLPLVVLIMIMVVGGIVLFRLG
jgi:hypothetical protein